MDSAAIRWSFHLYGIDGWQLYGIATEASQLHYVYFFSVNAQFACICISFLSVGMVCVTVRRPHGTRLNAMKRPQRRWNQNKPKTIINWWMSPEIYPFHMRIHYTQNTIKGNFPRELYVCVVCVCVLAKIAFFQGKCDAEGNLCATSRASSSVSTQHRAGRMHGSVGGCDATVHSGVTTTTPASHNSSPNSVLIMDSTAFKHRKRSTLSIRSLCPSNENLWSRKSNFYFFLIYFHSIFGMSWWINLQHLVNIEVYWGAELLFVRAIRK